MNPLHHHIRGYEEIRSTGLYDCCIVAYPDGHSGRLPGKQPSYVINERKFSKL
jgi:hypothetical protein